MRISESHYNEMEEKLSHFILSDLLKFIPATKQEVKKALESGDLHLNTIPLRKWDLAAGARFTGEHSAAAPKQNLIAMPGHIFYRSKWANSLSDRVCLLKHAARHHYLKEAK